ncbi:MAG: hypothetical protein ABIK18_01455, partial [candidate division WOR-3 bacterium]
MRRYLIISIVLAVVPVFAYTTISGGKGLFLVKDARTEEAGLNVALHLLGRNLTIPGTTDKGYIGDLIAPTLNWTPLSTQYVGAEIFANWGGIFQYAQVGDRVYDIGLHDLKAGAKISIPYLPVLKLGGMASYTFFFRDDGNRWIEQTAVPVDTFSWAGLATLRLQDLFSSLPNLMVNYGKAGVWTNYGLGLELAGEGMALFAELTSRQGVNSTGIFDTENGFVRLTPGVTFGSPRGFALTLGYGVSLTENSPNQVILGMNIATPFFRKPAVVFGELSGKVVDASSKQPVLATVEFPDNPKLKPLVTDAAGLFLVKKLPTGVLKVRVTAEGYRPLETFINVETKAAGP